MSALLAAAGVATALGALISAWVAAAVWLELYGVRARPDGAYDAVVVAGCRVHADGRPSGALVRRVEVAAAMYHRGHAPRIVLTGGIGKDAPVSEAYAAARLCEALGVPTGALVLEELSTTTLENAAFAANVGSPEWTVLVVSDTAHLYRCRRMFGRRFRAAHVVGATPPRWARIKLALREAGAVVRHGVRGDL